MSMRESISSILDAVSGVSVLAITLAGVLIHVWTIIISYSASGFLAAVVAFALPVASEVFWLVRLINKFGLLNPYSIVLLTYVIFIFVPVFTGLVSSALKKQN